MSNDKGLFTQTKGEYRELKDELVDPAYRRFCEELNLPFHFWDELPKDSFDPEISCSEFMLHKEAMNLFNRLKPELVLFKDNIVRFQFTSWDGTFSYDLYPIHEFFEQVSDERFYLKNLEKRFATTFVVLAPGIALLVFIVTVYLLGKFSPWVFLENSSIWLGIGLGGITYHLLKRLIRNIPHRIIDDEKFEGVAERINELRENLAKIGGSSPDFLRQKRLDRLTLEDFQQTIATADMEMLVHRLQSRLFIDLRGNNK